MRRGVGFTVQDLVKVKGRWRESCTTLSPSNCISLGSLHSTYSGIWVCRVFGYSLRSRTTNWGLGLRIQGLGSRAFDVRGEGEA